MELTEYISRLSFRYIQPRTKLPPGYGEFRKILGWFGLSLDLPNTRLPEEPGEVNRRLREICRVPRMSTIAIAALIHKCVDQVKSPHVFLNVGVWNGFSFLSGLVNNPDTVCIGVDNFSQFGGPREAFLARFEKYKSPRHQFHDVDYLEYFAKMHRDPIGFYIFDGPHTYEDQLMGLSVAEPFFSENCMVLVDDTNWEAAYRGTLDFIARSSHRYRMLLDQKTTRNCHPTFWNGVMLFQRVG